MKLVSSDIEIGDNAQPLNLSPSFFFSFFYDLPSNLLSLARPEEELILGCWL